ncbi:MAG: hypothetical protein V4473_02605 [Patescibacteria group bacterium]
MTSESKRIFVICAVFGSLIGFCATKMFAYQLEISGYRTQIQEVCRTFEEVSDWVPAGKQEVKISCIDSSSRNEIVIRLWGVDHNQPIIGYVIERDGRREPFKSLDFQLKK